MQKAWQVNNKNNIKAAYNLLQKPQYLTIQRYLLGNHFKAFYIYYPKGQEELGNEICIAPQEVMIQDSENLSRKEIVFKENPFFVKNGELGIKLTIEKNEKKLAADSFNELLKIGEDMVYQNDLEATVSLRELQELGLTEETANLLFSELNDGKISTRIRNYIEKNGLKDFIDWEKTNPQERSKKREIEEKVTNLLEHKFRQENPIAKKYNTCLGLFNYDRNGMNFDKYFGRGEHNVYFNYLISLKYGVLTPFSFVNITQNKELSQKIFEQLVKQSIVNKNGHLNPDLKKINFNFLKDLLSNKQVSQLKGFIEEMQAKRTETKYQNILERLADKEYLSMLEKGLAEERLQIGDISEFIKGMSLEEKQKLEHFYLEALISNEIENEVPKNRGIILTDGENILILVSDLVPKTSPYYNYLLAYFRAMFPEKQIQLAYAYTNPSPRTAQKKKHPLVMALYSIVQLRASAEYEIIEVLPDDE